MVITHNMAGSSATLDKTSSDSSGPQLQVHQTPPDQLIGNLFIDEAPRAAREVRERDPPDLHDVVTQQTEILQGMLAELRARQAVPAAVAVHPAEPPADPNFNWERLVLTPETNFRPQVGMASQLFARVPTMVGRDQHEARFLLQVERLWPDLSDEEQHWTFQRLNVYCIVAALGWPAARNGSTTATTDFFLPSGVVLPPPQGQNRRNRRDQGQP